MSEPSATPQAAAHRPRGYARWTAELGVAIVLAAAGALVVNGSLEQGVGWTPTGPESGYFPLRIGGLLVAVGAWQAIAAIAMAVRHRRHRSHPEVFLERDRLKPLMQVFLPMVAYLASVPWLGLYIASALFIAGFMWWHGGYRWRALPTGIAICAVFYVLLEVWFQVDLYKGPVLEWLAELAHR